MSHPVPTYHGVWLPDMDGQYVAVESPASTAGLLVAIASCSPRMDTLLMPSNCGSTDTWSPAASNPQVSSLDRLWLSDVTASGEEQSAGDPAVVFFATMVFATWAAEPLPVSVAMPAPPVAEVFRPTVDLIKVAVAPFVSRTPPPSVPASLSAIDERLTWRAHPLQAMPPPPPAAELRAMKVVRNITADPACASMPAPSPEVVLSTMRVQSTFRVAPAPTVTALESLPVLEVRVRLLTVSVAPGCTSRSGVAEAPTIVVRNGSVPTSRTSVETTSEPSVSVSGWWE